MFGSLVNKVSGGVMGGLDFLGPNKGKAPQYNSNYQVPQFNGQFNRYGSLEGQFGRREAPQAQAYTAQDGAFRGDQRAFGMDLRREAQGQGIGQQTVRMQAQNMGDRAQQQAYGMAASARPGSTGLNFANAAMAGAHAQSQVGGQAALAGGQMQLGAMGQYGQFLSGARDQDQRMSMFNAGQNQQNSQFNTSAQMQQTGMNDQARLEALRQRLQLSGMQQQGGLAYEQNAANYQQARMAQPSNGQMLLGAASGLGSAYMMGGLGGGGAAAMQTQPYGGARPIYGQYPGQGGNAGTNPYGYGTNG